MALLIIVGSACASSPPVEDTSSVDDSTGEDSNESTNADGLPAKFDEVYGELDGLEGEERDARLLELAQAESGSFTVYMVTNERESGPWLDSFTEETGIPIEHYRASASDLQQRITQEWEASFEGGADVVSMSTATLHQLDEATGEMFATLKSPYTEDMVPEAVADRYVSYSGNAFVVMWNTDNVPADEIPRSYEDVLTDFSGRIAFEVDDYKWFEPLMQDYFIPELGMSEEEVVELFREAVRGAGVVSGHTFLNTQIISGEYDISPHSYINRTQADVAEGAPVAWEPAVEPLVIQPNGAAMHSRSNRPATSLLFVEHLMSNIQANLPDQNFIPMRSGIPGDPTEGYDVIYQNAERIGQDMNYWTDLYHDIMQEAGGEVLSPDE